MNGAITVDIGEMYHLSRLLGQSADAMAVDDRRPDRSQVGHDGVHQSLTNFFGNWKHKRLDLAERLHKLSSGVAAAATAYLAIEKQLSDAFVLDHVSTGSTKTPSSGGAAGTRANMSPQPSAVAFAAHPTLKDLLRMTQREQSTAWGSLNFAQKKELLHNHASDLGELSIASPDVRYAANHQLVLDEYLRLNSKAHLSDSERNRMKLYERILRDHLNVLIFDPAGDGRIAVVDGDLVNAKHIAVTVPGISNSMDNYGNLIDEGQRLRGAAGTDTAVVSWLGYDAPVAVGLNPFRDVAEIRGTALAQAGATALVPFVHSLRVTNPGADVTVIGHSYGSLVTGLAAKNGLEANNVVFIGSPGVGAANVSQFHLLPGAKVYAMEVGQGASVGGLGVGGDPVANLGHNTHPFGAVPTEMSFGAQVIDIGGNVNVSHTHSSYYTAGSRSLTELAKITNGS